MLSIKEEFNSLREKAQQYYKVYGPLCNSEGFYQHTGECWSDTLQMLLLYSDGSKEIIQKKLIEEPVEYKEIEYHFTDFLENIIKSGEHSQNIEKYKISNLKAIFLYFKAVQERFLRHYVAEIKRFELIGPMKCYEFDKIGAESLEKLKDISKKYRSLYEDKEKEGILSARMGRKQNFYKMNRESLDNSCLKTGGKLTDIYYLIVLYNKYFNLNIEYSESTSINFTVEKSANCYWLQLTGDIYDTCGHATGFFQCGGNEYYYDDNEGVVLFPFKSFLKTYTEQKESTKDKFKINIVFTGELFIKDKLTNKILFTMKNYPFISNSITNEYITYFLNNSSESYILKYNTMIENIKSFTFTIESLEYVIIFNKDIKDRELNAVLSLFIPNEKTNKRINTQSGKYLSSRFKKQITDFELELSKGNKEYIYTLLKADPSMILYTNKNKNTLVHLAVQLKDNDFLKFLLDIPGVPFDTLNSKGFTPLHLAIIEENYSQVKALLEKGANIFQKCENNRIFKGALPIEILIFRNNETKQDEKEYAESLELIEYLFSKGDFSKNLKSFLLRTLLVENYKLLNVLLKNGLNINEPFNEEGDYILQVIFDTNYPSQFLFLLENGASLNTLNKAKICEMKKNSKKERIFIQPILEQASNEKKFNLQEQFEKYISECEEKKGGKFSRTRKNSCTKKRKTRKSWN
jgi:ankyrin repeat protein